MSGAPKTLPTLKVAVAEKSALVTIGGRANFTSSVDFKALILELRNRGYERFVLDLTNCITMDSTFLGVLASLAMGPQADGGGSKGTIELLRPNARVVDLLENLGIMHLFRIAKPDPECSLRVAAAAQGSPEVSREQISRTCLEAHQLLMSVNPENVSKFKDVTAFLAEDLQKIKKAGAPTS